MQPTDTTSSIRANWVWTGDGPPQANGCITFRNGRIVSVSTESPSTAIDLGPYCILPGLINCHTHLEFSDLRQPVGADGSFADWILRVVQRRQIIASDRLLKEQSSTDDGLVESYGHGVRLALDIVHKNADEPVRNSLPLQHANVPSGPLKIGTLPSTIRFAELMATTTRRAKQTWRGAVGLKRSSIEDGLFGLSPHAPYTTTANLIRKAVARCNRWKTPIMMHLAESLDEMRWVQYGDGPLQDLLDMVAGPDVLSTKNRLSIAGYVRELCQSPLALIVHGNYLDDPSMAILEANRDHAAVVYCPRTHAHFGHSIHPLMELRRRGIPVVLGTDSRASNPDLSIFDEARKVRQLFQQVSAAEIISMITTRPADLLGREKDWGYVQPGCLSRLTAIPCHTKRSEHVLEELLESSYPPRPLEPVVSEGI